MNNLEQFDQRWSLPDVSGGQSPIFVLAAGWRSGSTLLQRLICSTGEVLLWGEPYGRSGLLPAMARSALALRGDWPGPGHFAPETLYSELSRHWIANLYPPAEALKRGFAAQLDALLGVPARQRGYTRFGLKEVRLHAIDAQFLNWIYPQARFVFLVRNPWDAWASAKGGTWFVRWPDRRIQDAAGFAKHWDWLAKGFLSWKLPNAMLIRYEDLTGAGVDFNALSRHLGVSDLDLSVLKTRLRGMTRPPLALDAGEIGVIARITGEQSRALHYNGPTMRGALAS
jgi:hypothetical protein